MPEDELKVSVSEDRMSAFIRLPTDREITMQELRDALGAEGVRAGISPVALSDALRGPRGIFHQIAWGKNAEHSGSGAPVVVVKFPGSQGAPPRQMQVGQIGRAHV